MEGVVSGLGLLVVVLVGLATTAVMRIYIPQEGPTSARKDAFSDAAFRLAGRVGSGDSSSETLCSLSALIELVPVRAETRSTQSALLLWVEFGLLDTAVVVVHPLRVEPFAKGASCKYVSQPTTLRN